ncbi:Glycos_transf_1 domain-containing protein [Pseudomonas marincola]|uniref:Glycosyl transferase family 1 domain-containing protein n=1 Tax=Pseudomonas marincola TaxID=437900 RepID=A0A653E6Z8_9PSED|nr:glycosyltransferase [Pseudomonas marincola]CAE6910890.1 Glycos_transf_1 domain-containing protein [Pseudomonas marincola]
MEIVFLGGIFCDEDKEQVLESSKGTMQYAADTLQKNYLQGFSSISSIHTVSVINLPFLGAYPYRYSSLFYSPVSKRGLLGGVRVYNYKFINLIFVKNLHRFIVALKGLLSRLPSIRKGDAIVVCYSMHLPFLLACLVAKCISRKFHFCIIVPDLPEYMAVRKGFSSFMHKILSIASYSIVARADSVVAITRPMLNKLTQTRLAVVIEGIADERFLAKKVDLRKDKYFLYSGTLDRRYGIRNLIDSYLRSGVLSHELYICGDGDDRSYVEHHARLNHRVKYFGQLDRDIVLDMQLGACLLINPRDNESDYTKYSFPSKVIEYMSSGVPLLMYRLDGVPCEYYNYCYEIPSTPDGLKDSLVRISRLSDEELSQKGGSAKQFIIENKMPVEQVSKLINIIKGDCCVQK